MYYFKILIENCKEIGLHNGFYEQRMLTCNKFKEFPILFDMIYYMTDRLCGLVVRVSGYRYRGLGFDSRRYQIF